MEPTNWRDAGAKTLPFSPLAATDARGNTLGSMGLFNGRIAGSFVYSIDRE